MSAAPPPQPSSRAGARPAAPRRGRSASPGAREVPAERLALRRPAAVLPPGDGAGAVDVLWVLSAATAAVVVAPSPAAAGLGLALVLALRLAVVPLLPATATVRREGLAARAGHVVRAVVAVLLVVVLGVPAVAGAWWGPLPVALLAVVAELARPPVHGAAVGGLRRVLVAAVPALVVALVLGALGRAFDAVTGVLAAPAPAVLAVVAASVVLALRGRGTAPVTPSAEAPRRPWPDVAALRDVVGTAAGAARCAALLPVAVAAALAPLHAPGLSAGAAGAGLLVLACAAGALLGSAGATRWPVAATSPGTVLTLGAGASGALVLLAGPVTDLVLSAVLLALAGAAAASALIAAGRLASDGGRSADGRGGTGAQGVVLAVVVVLSAVLAGIVGGVVFPLGAAGSLRVGGAGVVMLLVGLASLLTAVVVTRALSDRPAGPLVPVLLRRGEHRDGAREGARDVPRPGLAAGGTAAGSPSPLSALGGPAASPHGLPGVLVALEGGDGAGKSTQATRLRHELERRGAEVVLTGEPGGTPLGVQVRSLLLDRGGASVTPRAEALLYAADRASHVVEVLRPALERGAVVLTDRYVDSSLAYQGAGRSLPRADVAALSAWASEGLVPDLVVVLDVDPSTSSARRRGRGADDRLDAEPSAFHARVREVFLELAREGGPRYAVVDAAAPVEQVTQQVLAHLQPLLPALTPPAADRRHEGEAHGGSGPEAVTGPATAVVAAVGEDAGSGPDQPRRAARSGDHRPADERVPAEARAQEDPEQGPAATTGAPLETSRPAEREAHEREAREREAREVEQRREREAAERREREAAEVRERERTRRRVAEERARAEVRARTSVRSAEVAVTVARGLGDARRPVTESASAATGATTAAAPAPLPVRLPEERLQQLPDAVRRSAVDVAAAQREARVVALQQLDRREREQQAERRRAAEEQRAAERREREEAERARAEQEERRRAEEMARREEQEARAEEERRAASRRRADTEAVDVGSGAARSRERQEPPRTAEMPVVGPPGHAQEDAQEDAPEDAQDDAPEDAPEDPQRGAPENRGPDGADDRPALHELQAADRRRQAQQRARRRAAASRRRAEGDAGTSSVRGQGGRAGADGPLADQLFSMQEPWEEPPGGSGEPQEPGAPDGGDGRR